jgi:glycosyltransferase involved in cell wall biosynthesis
MICKFRVTFITIVPSPYQRDLFRTLAARPEIELRVYYMEAASPDSPWPEATLRAYETILPGFWMPLGRARWHFNWRLPDVSHADYVVLSSFSSLTGQWLMRHGLRGKQWLFWGEFLRGQPGRLRELVQRKLTAPLGQATGIVGIGRQAESDYRKRFPQTKHFCIPYHCDQSAFLASNRDRTGSEPLTFLFCGQMIRRKGVDLLLTAFDRLVAKGADVRLLLVGREAKLSGYLAALRPAARARIRYEGFQPPESLPAYFSQSDVFILPSRHDGWGVVINQALGAGLPVITSDAAGAGLDLVEDEINGLRFPAGEMTALLRCMERFVAQPELAQQWGKASRRKALTITPQAGAEKWVRVFEELSPRPVARRRPGALIDF